MVCFNIGIVRAHGWESLRRKMNHMPFPYEYNMIQTSWPSYPGKNGRHVPGTPLPTCHFGIHSQVKD